jgi:hypothetical protein
VSIAYQWYFHQRMSDILIRWHTLVRYAIVWLGLKILLFRQLNSVCFQTRSHVSDLVRFGKQKHSFSNCIFPSIVISAFTVHTYWYWHCRTLKIPQNPDFWWQACRLLQILERFHMLCRTNILIHIDHKSIFYLRIVNSIQRLLVVYKDC